SEIWAPAEFGEKARELGLTVANLPTAFWHLYAVDADPLPECARLIIIGGERLSVDSLPAWHGAVTGSTKLLNAYGPTEVSVTSTLHEIPESLSGSTAGSTIPIGRPFGNRTTYILDKHGVPVGIGMRGELYIGGRLPARGYLNRPGLTAEKFTPDPFSAEAGSRLYRTGDLARYLPDGAIEFLGRADDQGKIRGFRIELGEIENALSQHELVRQAVVLVVEGSAHNKSLVAYVTTRDDAEVPSSHFRRYLASKLPDFMVPALYVQMKQMPLTRNGKIDKRALLG